MYTDSRYKQGKYVTFAHPLHYDIWLLGSLNVFIILKLGRANESGLFQFTLGMLGTTITTILFFFMKTPIIVGLGT